MIEKIKNVKNGIEYSLTQINNVILGSDDNYNVDDSTAIKILKGWGGSALHIICYVLLIACIIGLVFFWLQIVITKPNAEIKELILQKIMICVIGIVIAFGLSATMTTLLGTWV